ncbi:MAG TPA: hypothetical protein PKD55_03570 [Bellilinea sp.]|nr:hypothetical protein [Bellilinea sp.]
MENGLFAQAVAKLKRVFKIQHLIQANQPFGFQLLEQIEALKQHGYPVGLKQPKDDAPKPGTGRASAICGDSFSLESNPLPVKKRFLSLLDGIRQDWKAVSRLLWLLNRRAELKRLVGWATRRHLTGPHRYYQQHLDDVERKLLRCQLECPGIMRWARWVHFVNRVLFRPPRYPARGSAAGYAARKHLSRTHSFERKNWRLIGADDPGGVWTQKGRDA